VIPRNKIPLGYKICLPLPISAALFVSSRLAARQVTVRAETALLAFTTQSNGGWIMFGKNSG
jgi:hypothetical protein